MKVNLMLYREHLERDEMYARERLEDAASQLASDMDTLARRLREHPTSTINSLGEVQGQGASVDTACARFYAARAALKTFDSYMESSSTATGAPRPAPGLPRTSCPRSASPPRSVSSGVPYGSSLTLPLTIHYSEQP